MEPITTEIEFPSNRLFQLWAYRVGHSQLLLRSNPDERSETRIELLFRSVSSLHLPTAMSGLTVRVLEDTNSGPPWVVKGVDTVYSVSFEAVTAT